MKEFGIALTRENLLVVLCEPLSEIMKVEHELDQVPHASNALAYLMGGGQVIMPEDDVVVEILKFFPSAQPEPQPALGLPPDATAPQLSQIRTLVALSEATGETTEQLLGYTAPEMKQLFAEVQVGILGQKKIEREMEGLRAVLSEPDVGEPEPEPVSAEPEPEPMAESAHVLDLGELREKHSLTGHSGSVSALTLFSGSGDGSIKVWRESGGTYVCYRMRLRWKKQ